MYTISKLETISEEAYLKAQTCIQRTDWVKLRKTQTKFALDTN
jgi:hypothetical protein